MKFKDYEIVKTLGPSVYQIVQKPLDRTAILKVLEPPYAEETISRFEREARICSQLKTEGVVKIYDFGSWRKRFYIVSEFVEGMDLGKLIAEKGPFPFDVAQYVMLILAKTLDAVHSQGIIHRDLKPSNILIADDGSVKISDFGLARSLKLPSVTLEGSIIGTPGYMSPEQVTAQPLDQRTDIFSLGVVFYELLTGTNPFSGKTYSEIITNITKIRPRPIPNLNPALRDGIQKMLQKDPSKRLKNLSPVVEVLEKLPGTIERAEFVRFLQAGSSARPPLKPRASGWMRALYLLILVPGLVYFGFRLVPKHPSPSPATAPEVVRIQPAKPLPRETTRTVAVSTPIIKTGDGYLQITVNPWAEIYIDGADVGRTPISQPLKLASGVHSLKLIYEEQSIYEETLTIQAGQTDTLAVDLKDYIAYLSIQVSPWGKVYIDGSFKGETPFAQPIVVPRGEHKITVTHPEYPPKEETIHFRPKEVVYKTIHFP
jgi:hypothetical protein